MVPRRRTGAALADIEAVYRTRFGQFCSVAAAILDSREAARDAVQDAFAKAVRNRREFRGEGSLDAWLWRAVVNTALSQGRYARNGAAPAIEEERIDAGGDDDVRAAIRGLPERQRLVVFLRYWA